MWDYHRDHEYVRASDETMIDCPDVVVICRKYGDDCCKFEMYNKETGKNHYGATVKGKKQIKKVLWKIFKEF